MSTSTINFYLDLDVDSSTASLKRPPSEDFIPNLVSKEVNIQAQESYCKDSDDLSNDVLKVQEVKGRSGWHKVTNLKNTFGELSAYNNIM